MLELPLYNGIGEEDSAASDAPPPLRRPETGRLLIDEAVDRLRDDTRAVRPVWLPPLPERLSLQPVVDRDRTAGDLDVVVGLEDDPAHQQQKPWVVDLTKAGGHVAIIGSPQSGRSTLLRTIGASLALTKTPTEVAVYGMDLTGGGLRRIEGFPHVGGVATRGDRGRLGRLLEEIGGMLAHRERVFKERGIDSVAHLRALHRAGQLPELAAADILLLVDGYGALRQDFDDLESAFTDIMLRASSFGVHLVLGLTRWSEVRMAHQSLFGTRIELRLNDPADSAIDRKLAQTISAETPGRALTDAKTLAQVALPVLDLVESDDIGSALEQLAERSAAAWSGPFAAPIRLLPTDLDPAELPDPVDEPDAIPLGLRQDTMGPATWDFTRDEQHLLVLGDARSGKTNALRLIAHGLIERFTPEELAIAVVDPRGHVADAIPEDYLAAHAKTARQAAGLASSIASELAQRPGRTPEENRRSPRVVVLVDDHDIVSAGGAEHLAPLVEQLPASRDTKLHIVAARPVAGAARALYGALLQGLRDTGGATLLLSGDRAEGQILPRLYPERFPPGRGRYVRRGERPRVIQIAHLGRAKDDDR
ncbi:type VII secretion protein EccCb [Microbacterium betulae]|uniref:Type VII secretion protein EccCb n=1 Tax=Microbacterium betulae TaxID=2981139 RepID=A0AA97I4K8_9MICO|nr:type VII secretion protein EccCb [Microbacterium sp. AB]WOF22711.1 type VII secretion protein EccCb [Microbacterium sp. AB]